MSSPWDDAILRSGLEIAPAEVEEVLERHPAVREASVVGLPEPRLGSIPLAAVELEEGAPETDPDQLRGFAREHFAHCQVPARIPIVEACPARRRSG